MPQYSKYRGPRSIPGDVPYSPWQTPQNYSGPLTFEYLASFLVYNLFWWILYIVQCMLSENCQMILYTHYYSVKAENGLFVHKCLSLAMRLNRNLRILARYEAQNRPLFYISFDIFINKLSFKNLNVLFLTKGPQMQKLH